MKGMIFLKNAEVISNVCLICINVENECTNAISCIEKSLSQYSIDILFISAVNIFGHGDKIYIAVSESDLFLTMNALGSVKSDAQIRNYSINCSNCMIRWQGSNEYSALSKAKCDIKLLMKFPNENICFCDNSYQRKACSILNKSTL